MQKAHVDYTFNLSSEHVREEADGSLTVSGYASNWDVDRVGNTVTRDAMAKALEGYMRNPALLYDHKYSQPAGVVTRARVDDRGLWIEAKVVKPRPDAPNNVRHYFELVRRGVLRALSIGGVWSRDAARRLVSIDLREISLASVGVNAGTMLSAQTAKAFGDLPSAADTINRADLALLAIDARLERVRTDCFHSRAEQRPRPAGGRPGAGLRAPRCLGGTTGRFLTVGLTIMAGALPSAERPDLDLYQLHAR